MRLIIILLGIILLTNLVTSQGIAGVTPAYHNFEDILRGGYAERTFTITYSGETEIGATIIPRGEIASWMNFTQNKSKISKSNPWQLTLSIEPPIDTPNGNYSGYIQINTESLGGPINGQFASSILATLEVSINVEIVDTEIIQCTSSNYQIFSAEKGDDIVLKADVLNTGNVRLRPKFSVNMWDQEQISIVKTESLTGKEILPTKKETLTFNIKTNDLAIEQYWAEINSLDCFDTTTLTFDVFEPGTLKAQGILQKIIAPPSAFVDDTFPIIAIFDNVGEKRSDAQFRGQITLNGKIVQVYESEITQIGIGESANFTFFFTPRKAGEYIASGRVFYDKKRTFESSAIIPVYEKALTIKSILLFIGYTIIILLIIILYYKIRKTRRKKYHGL